MVLLDQKNIKNMIFKYRSIQCSPCRKVEKSFYTWEYPKTMVLLDTLKQIILIFVLISMGPSN